MRLRFVFTIATLLSVLNWTSVSHAKPLDERTRFRNFISGIVLCAAKVSPPEGAECVKASIRAQPESLKWFSDPDRIELIFQASRLDDIGERASELLRENIQKNIEALTPQIKSFIPKIGESK